MVLSKRRITKALTRLRRCAGWSRLCCSQTPKGRFSRVEAQIKVIFSKSARCAYDVESVFICLFDLILYVPSTIFQINRDGSSWVEPVLSKDKCVLLKDHNALTSVRLKPAASRSRVRVSFYAPIIRFNAGVFGKDPRPKSGDKNWQNVEILRKILTKCRNWWKYWQKHNK